MMKLSRIIFCTQLYVAIVYGGITVQRESDEIVNLEKDRDDAPKMPSFEWDGNTRLVITFPDGSKDTALLEKTFPDDDCIFKGKLENEEESNIAVNGCPGESDYDITLFSHKTEYEIFEVRGGIVNLPPKVKKEDLNERSVEGNRRDCSTEVDSEQLRASLPSSMELRVALLFDDKWYAIFGDNYKKPMYQVVNLAQSWYQHWSLDVKMSVKIMPDADGKTVRYIPGNFMVGQEGGGTEVTTAKAKEMITGAYGEWGNNEPDVYVIFSEDDSGNSGGIALGIGNVCSSCRGNRVGIVEGLMTWQGGNSKKIDYQWTGLMFAHEIGHLLGFTHDFESGGFNNNRNKCPNSGEYAALVMSYGWSDSRSEDKWSSCSNMDFRRYITGQGRQQGGRFCSQATGEAVVTGCCEDCSTDQCNFEQCASNKNYGSWFTDRCSGSMKSDTSFFGRGITMGEGCKKTCGLCGGGTTTVAQTCKNTPAGSCNAWSCDTWASNPGCNAYFASYSCGYGTTGQVKDYCQTSCQTCG